MNQFKATTEDGLVFEISDNDLQALNIIKNQDGSYHFIFENRSFNVEILFADYLQKRYVLNVNEKEIAVTLRSELDVQIQNMGYSGKSDIAGGVILSPMPGLVVKLNVREGDRVEKSQALLILEAMKMENIIKSPVSGDVKKLLVKEGDSVSKRQVLIEIA